MRERDGGKTSNAAKMSGEIEPLAGFYNGQQQELPCPLSRYDPISTVARTVSVPHLWATLSWRPLEAAQPPTPQSLNPTQCGTCQSNTTRLDSTPLRFCFGSCLWMGGNANLALL